MKWPFSKGKDKPSSSATVNVLSAYKLEATEELFKEAMELKYGDTGLSGADLREAEEAVREELAGVALLEVLVTGRDDRFDVGDFSQEGSDQAPYNEVYLNSDGTEVVSDSFQAPPGDPLRIAFYLHYFDPSQQLKTSSGSVLIPPLQPMPERLRNLAPYEPVD